MYIIERKNMTAKLNKLSMIAPQANTLAKGIDRPVFSFKDDAIGYTEVFSIPNDALAVRTFTELCNNKQHPMGKYYNQMSLWKIALYNDATGEVTAIKPELVIRGNQVVISND